MDLYPGASARSSRQPTHPALEPPSFHPPERPLDRHPPTAQPPAVSAAMGHNRAYHYADMFGADGRRIGRVRYGFSFRRPLDSLLKQYRYGLAGWDGG